MIKLVKSSFYNELETKKKLCKFILEADKFSMGKECSEFESEFSKYQKRKYSVLLNSGSSANLALIQSLLNLGKLKPKDNVGFSSLTWATNVMPLMQLGLTPVPLDVSMDNLNSGSKDLLEVLENHQLRALFITNLLGFCADLDRIAKICRDRGIILLEDNCESFGSTLNRKRLGNFGLASTSSFYVGHHLSTIEGGMVCTDDEDLHDMLLMVRAHGWDRNLSGDKKDKLKRDYDIDDFHSRYTFYAQAYNLRPTEFQGFLGKEQLRYMDTINKIRNCNYIEFNDAARSNGDFHKLDLNHMSFVSNFAYPLICRHGKALKEYKDAFIKKDIEIRPIVGGSIVEQPFFREYTKRNKENFSCNNARKIHQNGFYFPNNPELTGEEKEVILSILRG